MVEHLMEQHGLKQVYPAPILGSRASDLVNGKRGVSKAQAKLLAGFLVFPLNCLLI